MNERKNYTITRRIGTSETIETIHELGALEPKTVFDLMHEFNERLLLSEEISGESIGACITAAIEDEHSVLIWDDGDEHTVSLESHEYDTTDEAIAAAIEKGKPCFIIPDDPILYCPWIERIEKGRFCLSDDAPGQSDDPEGEDYLDGLEEMVWDSLASLLNDYVCTFFYHQWSWEETIGADIPAYWKAVKNQNRKAKT